MASLDKAILKLSSLALSVTLFLFNLVIFKPKPYVRAYGRYFTLRSCYDLEFSHMAYDEKVSECTFLGLKIEKLVTRLA